VRVSAEGLKFYLRPGNREPIGSSRLFLVMSIPAVRTESSTLSRARDRCSARRYRLQSADPSAQDGCDHLGGLEEGSPLRRPIFETTNSLSVSGNSFHPRGSILVVGGFLRHSGSRASLSWLVRRCVPRALSLTSDPRPSRTTRKSYGPRVPNRTMVST